MGQKRPPTYTEQGEDTRTCKHDATHKETRPIPQLTYTAPSITELGTWLTSQPANTADTAYRVVLNVNDISNIRTTLNAAPNKYVYLDLSGSTITTIPEFAFNTGPTGNPALTGCTTLTGIILPNSVTSIGDRAFQRCTSLTSVTFAGTIPSSGLSQNAFNGIGDLRAKFYATNASNGTPGTYTTTAPVGENSVWTKQN